MPGIDADDFRRLALALPGAIEGAHMGHADFRVRKKIFATLGAPDAQWGMVKLAPEQQELFIRVDAAFTPAKGRGGGKAARSCASTRSAPTCCTTR